VELKVNRLFTAVINTDPDNALAEAINGLCKAEVIHRQGPWRSLELATAERVDWWHYRRLTAPLKMSHQLKMPSVLSSA